MHDEQIRQQRDWLNATYPNCFMRRGRDKWPIKTGIINDILARHPEIDQILLEAAVEDYTTSPTYLRNVRSGNPRIDLFGMHAGWVSPTDERHAQRRLVIENRNRAVEKRLSSTAKVRDEALCILYNLRTAGYSCSPELQARIEKFIARFPQYKWPGSRDRSE